MYGKSIGDTEAFQKVKSNWLYHQRQKHCCIQAALILQEPIDISPGIELLTTPSAAKAESALGVRGAAYSSCIFLNDNIHCKKGPSPLPLGLWDLFLQPHHHQTEFWVLWKCSSADSTVFGDEDTLRAGEETQPPNHSLVWLLMNMKETGASKTMGKLTHSFKSVFIFLFIGFCVTECVGAMIYCVIPSLF